MQKMLEFFKNNVIQQVVELVVLSCIVIRIVSLEAATMRNLKFKSVL